MTKAGVARRRGRPPGHGPKVDPNGLYRTQNKWLKREASHLQPMTSAAAYLRAIVDEHIARREQERRFGVPVEGLPVATPDAPSESPHTSGG